MNSDPQHGDRASDFIPLIMGCQRELKSYLFSLHPHAGDIDDLLQETSLKLWEIFGEYDSTRPFLPWALRIAYFQVLRFRKERSRDRLVFSDDLVELLAGEAPAAGQADVIRASLDDCLAKLTPRARQVLLARYNRDANVSELAKETRQSVHALYRLLEKARGQVATCLHRLLAAEGHIRPATGASD